MPASNLACPTCLQGGVENPLLYAQGRFGYFCRENHIFSDTEELRGMKLQNLSRPQPETPKAPPAGSVEMRFMVPGKLRDYLQSRFEGARLNTAMNGILEALADDGTFIISSLDANRLKELFGQPITNSGSLVGNVYAMKAQRDEANGVVERMRTMGGGGGGNGSPKSALASGVVVELDDGDIQKLSEKATFQGTTIPDLLKQTVKFGLENGWF